MSGSVAPDLIEPVVGFRKWRLVRDHLTSPYIPLRWDEPVVRARCFPANRGLMFGEGWLDEPHAAPHPHCQCGVYAWHRLPRFAAIPDPDRAFGIVSMSGRIEVHEDGMRAERATIRALGYSPKLGKRHRQTMRTIAGRLGVDLVEEPSLAEAAQAFGGPIPAALLPVAA